MLFYNNIFLECWDGGLVGPNYRGLEKRIKRNNHPAAPGSSLTSQTFHSFSSWFYYGIPKQHKRCCCLSSKQLPFHIAFFLNHR